MASPHSKVSSSSFDELNSSLQGAALKATRHALSLPADLAFHRSMDSKLAQTLDAFSARVLSVTNDLLTLVSTADSTQSTRGKGKLKLECQDDVVDSFQSLVVDAMDQLLERADMNIDEHLGRIKPPAIAVNPTAEPTKKKTDPWRGRLDPVLQHASHLPKPQLQFKTKVDNINTSPWYPTLTHKYNAQVPLGHYYVDTDDDTETSLHPYHYEIKHIMYPDRMFQPCPPIPPKSFDDTPFSWIATPSEFTSMLEKLRCTKEIAVDLEHHNYRSWAGFLCLMQITTREEDFVVDAIALRDEMQELNEVFTDPRIVKIFHGAASDIVWLQQDFNLYVVNLFDTYHASKVLEFARHGLAHLLEAYCDFTADKRYQLADWRIRPLPEEMLLYARSDTHFLLYIYDNLRNALLDRAQTSPPESSSIPPNRDPAHALVYEVLSQSEETARRLYEKEVYDPEGGGPGGWDSMAKKWNKGKLTDAAPDSVEREVYKRLHAWRDKVAREEDESRSYILSNNYLFQLAERPPADMATFLTAFKSVPPVIRRRAKEFLDIIQETVREYRDSVKTAEADDSNIESTSDSVQDTPMIEVEVTSTDTLNSRLWAKVPQFGNLPTASASSSTLFGSTLAAASDNQTTAPKRYFASASALFSSKQSASAKPNANTSTFKDIVSRIHSALVIAPSAPRIDPDQVIATPDAVSAVVEDQPAGPPGQIEIPYIPAAQRQQTSIIDDSIVVVGQARQKKRKRVKSSSTRDVELGSAKRSAVDAEISAEARQMKELKRKEQHEEDSVIPQEPFDYSAVPNLLDDVPTSEYDTTSRQKKKQKQNKGGVLEYGNFPAPPKAHREPKSGNQSYTFK